jgi:NADH:ubiquinone oxidoreductase subunit F (NADH-binding)/(2Fe-2S) ferredoxin
MPADTLHPDTVLELLQRQGSYTLYPGRVKITVGRATCGLAAGADEVYRYLREETARRRLEVLVAATGCLGWCQQEPLVTVQVPGRPRLVYGRVDIALAGQILDGVTAPGARELGSGSPALPDTGLLGRVYSDEMVVSGQRIFLTGEPESDPVLDRTPFFAPQLKIATRNCGYIDPDSMAEYAARGGYLALWNALRMQPAEIIEEILASGLRGRGGGGYPTGRKWQLTRQQPGEVKYVICNADEGDPGAYMDRSVLEGDPHTVLEGMVIGGYAIGAHSGIIYVRSEYPLAVARLQEAIRQARENGLLGTNILGSGFDFELEVVKGQGAFVCGEETALIASIEGRPGEPRPRPPYPSEIGLWGRPTCINNVETWANIPPIILRGSAWFAGIGTASSKGTKVFSLVGDIRSTGLVEVPMGTTLRRIMDAGGGAGRFAIKAVQTGGPSGGCIPADRLDLPVDYEALTEAGSIMGSGGMVVMDERTCMVDVARYFLSFIQEESCGKCTACREGTWQMLQILNRIAEGKASLEDLEHLEQLALAVKDASLCQLGQTAPSPVLSTLRYFRDEYVSHIRDRFCPAGVCHGLFRLVIDQDACTGCGRCIKNCPAEAIMIVTETGAAEEGSGVSSRAGPAPEAEGAPGVSAPEKAGSESAPEKAGATYQIDQGRCIQCRNCLNVCPSRAVRVIPWGVAADADHH